MTGGEPPAKRRRVQTAIVMMSHLKTPQTVGDVLALCAHLGRGAMLTSVAVIAATALSLGLRGRALGGPPIDTTGALMGSSLVAVASLVSWLLLLELTLMGRRGLARARRTSAAR